MFLKNAVKELRNRQIFDVLSRLNRKLFVVFITSVSFSYTYEIKMICNSPRIYFIDHFLTDMECDFVIEEAFPQLQRSTVLSDKVEGTIDHRRTSQGMFFPQNPSSSVLQAIEQRIEEMTQIPKKNGEALHALHYEIGGEYQPHYDYFIPTKPGGAETLKRGGQRIATCIMYLNTPEEGGETIFPLAKISITPKRGGAILFYNVTANGNEDPRSLHGGAPVIKGEKWIVTKWLRAEEFY